MYKLLIADDEPLVQVGIKSMLPWDSMQIKIIGIASNGQAACEIIEKDMPDIIITDIKMPIMSGLELAKYCNEHYAKPPAFIILTSYEDFSLAREALSCHVHDYLVKLELTPELLKTSIEKLLAELSANAAKEASDDATDSIYYYQEKFYIQLLNNLFESREQFFLQSQKLNISFTEHGYLTCYCEIVNRNLGQMTDEQQINLYHSSFQMAKELLFQYQKSHVIMLDLYHLAIVFCFEKEEKLEDIIHSLTDITKKINDTLYKYYRSTLSCGFGTYVTDPLAISESYQYSRDAFSRTTPDKQILFFDTDVPSDTVLNSFNFSLFKDTLSIAFEEYDSAILKKTFDDIVSLFKANPSHYLQAIDFASNILYLAISLLPNGETKIASIFADSPDNYLMIYKMNNMEQILGWLSYFQTSLCEYLDEKKKETRKPIVGQAKRYIKNHMDSKLSLQEVAAALCISPNYLSQLFKKYNETGFNDYVTQCKIEEAKRYLNSGEYCIYEIAEKLGFESSFYFSKVFKKVEGVSPSDFQKNKLP